MFAVDISAFGPLKSALRTGDGECALLVSGYLYDEVIRHGSGLTDPAEYQCVTVTHKETRTDAWLWPRQARGALSHDRGVADGTDVRVIRYRAR